MMHLSTSKGVCAVCCYISTLVGVFTTRKHKKIAFDGTDGGQTDDITIFFCVVGLQLSAVDDGGRADGQKDKYLKNDSCAAACSSIYASVWIIWLLYWLTLFSLSATPPLKPLFVSPFFLFFVGC